MFKRGFFIVALLLFVGVQIRQTIVDESVFPFSSYGMFNNLTQDTSWVLKAHLRDNEGEITSVDVAHLFPVEFFKTRGFITNVFLKDTPQEKRRAFATRIVERLNQSPWSGFDETEAAAKAKAGRHYVDIKIEAFKVNTASFKYGEEIEVVKQQELFSGLGG